MELILKADSLKISKLLILYERSSRFMRMAILLHVMAIIGIALFFGFGQLAIVAFDQHQITDFLLYGYLSAYGFTLPFFAELDARSRYQNYKAVKDALHRHDFQTRIVDLFIISRCQRDAIKIAAQDLGYERELQTYYYKQGYRWYYILPDFLFHTPSMLFTRFYWKKTLFVKNFQSRYFLW